MARLAALILLVLPASAVADRGASSFTGECAVGLDAGSFNDASASGWSVGLAGGAQIDSRWAVLGFVRLAYLLQDGHDALALLGAGVRGRARVYERIVASVDLGAGIAGTGDGGRSIDEYNSGFIAGLRVDVELVPWIGLYGRGDVGFHKQDDRYRGVSAGVVFRLP